MFRKDTRKYHTFLTTPLFAMGQNIEGESGLRINEVATRARAGLLNILSMLTIMIVLFKPELDPIIYVGPFVIFDMTAAAIFGLTPFSPVGMLGTFLTMKIKPVWKPTKPKRFAWVLGSILGILCLSFRLFELPDMWIVSVLAVCFLLTWLEAVLGFCVGCWMHSMFFGCEVCELS